MLEGVIQPGSSPWCAPAVYVPREIRICVDFVQLNRVTKKDSYPVPRADRPIQRLAGKQVFSKLDLEECLLAVSNGPRIHRKDSFQPSMVCGNLWLCLTD